MFQCGESRCYWGKVSCCTWTLILAEVTSWKWEFQIVYELKARRKQSLRSSVNLSRGQNPCSMRKQILRHRGWTCLTNDVVLWEQIQRLQYLVMRTWYLPALTAFASEVGLVWFLSASVPHYSSGRALEYISWFSFIWKKPDLCTPGLLHSANKSALARVIGRFVARVLSLSELKY